MACRRGGAVSFQPGDGIITQPPQIVEKIAGSPVSIADVLFQAMLHDPRELARQRRPEIVDGPWRVTQDGRDRRNGRVTDERPLAFDTTQIFLLSDDRNALFTEGMEGNLGVTTHRAVTGGTGGYRAVVGTVKQETIGVNRNGAADGLFDLRFTFTVRPAE